MAEKIHSLNFSSPHLHCPASLRWLLSPAPGRLSYALRLSLSACLALAIALWMELDSPGWAAITVCVICQPNRGESLSKASHRIFGTLSGAFGALFISSLAPQYPFLFFMLLGGWVSMATFMATLSDNFRTYAWFLCGYSCVITTMNAAPDMTHVFDYAIARVTYVILGIICELGVTSIFSSSVSAKAKERFAHDFSAILKRASRNLLEIFVNHADIEENIRLELFVLLERDKNAEFFALEMEGFSHAADHVRAAMSQLTVLTLKLLEMSICLRGAIDEKAASMARSIAAALDDCARGIIAEEDIPRASLLRLRNECGLARGATSTPAPFYYLEEMLSLVDNALGRYERILHARAGDGYRFRGARVFDWRAAKRNSIRSFIAIMAAAFIYECTAWPNGFQFVAITALCVSLFATHENSILGNSEFFKGAVASWMVAGLLVLELMPRVTVFEPLIIIVGGTLFLGALLGAVPSYAIPVSAFMALFMNMLGFQNHHVMNETDFWNVNMASIAGCGASVLVFKTLWPYRPSEECRHAKDVLLGRMRKIADLKTPSWTQAWVSYGAKSFADLEAHIRGYARTPEISTRCREILSILLFGLNILELKALLAREYLPLGAPGAITALLSSIRGAKPISADLEAARASIRPPSVSDEAERSEADEALVSLEAMRKISNEFPNFLNQFPS